MDKTNLNAEVSPARDLSFFSTVPMLCYQSRSSWSHVTWTCETGFSTIGDVSNRINKMREDDILNYGDTTTIIPIKTWYPKVACLMIAKYILKPQIKIK